jgi:hypothetical protein
MIYQYLFKLTVSLLFLIAYYKYAKLIIIFYTPHITRLLKLTTYFPAEDIKGALELALIALSHVLFCALLLWLFPLQWPKIEISWIIMPIYLVYGILLGIGCLCLSMLFSKIAMEIINTTCKRQSYDLKTWLTLSRGGWIKHHLQSMEILPIYFSLLVLCMQVGSEEIIFRGIMLNYFMSFGKCIASITSITFFVFMQAFLMNRWQAAIFPMIGAMVMGTIHSILYLQVPILWPLIIAHMTFFLFSIL